VADKHSQDAKWPNEGALWPTVRALGVRKWKLSNVRKGQSSDRTKIYYLELLRASEGTLSLGPCYICSHLHQGGLTSGRRPVVKIVAEFLSQHDTN
jgi:hypothetical protein